MLSDLDTSASTTQQHDGSVAAACNDAAVQFISVPPLGADRAHGPIVSIRRELVEVARLQCLTLLSSVGGEQGNRDELAHLPPQPALIIERSVRGSAATVQHVYSLGEEPLQLLRGLQDADDAIEEDERLLAFTRMLLAGGDGGGIGGDDFAGSGARAALHKRLRPLQAENAAMRAALGISTKATQRVDAAVARQAVRALQETYYQQRRAAEGASAATSPTPAADGGAAGPSVTPPSPHAAASNSSGTSQQQQHHVPGVLSTAPGHTDLHSPLQWEMETEAAVNARTRYDPYRRKSPAGQRQVLDAVTQQQLVTRLHDKSVDERDKRLAEYRDRIERELGQHERRVLSSEEQQNLGQRLHDQQREHSKKLREEAELRAHGPPPPKRKFSPSEQHTSNDRIYREPRDKTKRVMDQLFQRYIVEEEAKIPKLRLSQEQQKAMADRLCQKH